MALEVAESDVDLVDASRVEALNQRAGKYVLERQTTNISEKTTSTRADSKAERPEGWRSIFNLDRVANFRDAAGPDPSLPYRCHKGRLRSGLLYRTGHWVTATEADLARIRDSFGVRTYVDLRSGQDFESVDAECFDYYPPSPCGRHAANIPRSQGERRRVSCPFSKALGMRPLTEDEKAGRVPPDDLKAQCSLWFQQQIRSKSFEEHKVQLYTSMRAMLILNDDEILKALQVLLEEENYPVAFGCIAGKDRTGLLAALVHAALGVSEEDVIADYLLTNEASHHIHACNMIAVAMWTEELRIRNPTRYCMLMKRKCFPAPAECHRLLDSDPELPLWEEASVVGDPDSIGKCMVQADILEYVLHDVLQQEFGGVIPYLEHIGFTKDDLKRLRSILVEEC
eukprot:TRINITY_DN28838_c0_g2_i1.p1 TRINITY_DN28838_c0_g2~~TRINITY_DN28838_c0_g2_i1.p1  ORF type:complete len:415 (-),score=81.75 TRINITY_DN28838_c0_g2_i1:45-1238(-)